MPEAHDALVFFKRHTDVCDVHKQKLPAAKQRYWMQCRCPIWVVGKMPNGDIVNRGSTGKRTLDEARAHMNALIKRQTTDEEVGPTIEECRLRYISKRKADGVATSTDKQNRLYIGRFQDFCEAQRVFLIRQVTVDIVETFKEEGLVTLDKRSSQQLCMTKVSAFLREAFRRGWIKLQIAERVDKVTGIYDEDDQASPFTPDEIRTLLRECLNVKNRGGIGYTRLPKTFRLLLELMLYTGLRVSDAVMFDPKDLKRGEGGLWVYRFLPNKRRRADRPKYKEIYVRDQMKTAIDQCEWLSADLPFAYGGSSYARLGASVYERMKDIGYRSGIPDCRPHRLRDTFSVTLLTAGVQLDDVSRLLCHSSVKITEMYYAKWIPARGNRLEGVMAKALDQTLDGAFGDAKTRQLFAVTA